MKISATILILYGVFILAGGIVGFYGSHSTPSLIAGLVSALLIFGSACAIHRNYSIGYPAGVLITVTLLIFFIYRYLFTGKFMPAGFITIVSLITLGILIFQRDRD
jgi:uncharacterized membrane protein (UPF0136 family)